MNAMSEILEYTRRHPHATDEEIRAYVHEPTKKRCPSCLQIMLRYEAWNGCCSGCDPDAAEEDR